MAALSQCHPACILYMFAYVYVDSDDVVSFPICAWYADPSLIYIYSGPSVAISWKKVGSTPNVRRTVLGFTPWDKDDGLFVELRVPGLRGTCFPQFWVEGRTQYVCIVTHTPSRVFVWHICQCGVTLSMHKVVATWVDKHETRHVCVDRHEHCAQQCLDVMLLLCN